ncbi:hypothetical protein [Streptomyces litchfieldiae]|uniref:Uncharacterized protein n=1 Tax=Streptomyces litchfieldiae TaxID=3075543 RepID=A0ABU2N2F4_9ACTN|nr:hypothetical protein [Streptomyces sp. DSM 44938]MDT0346914.1 hypothetical protein [Streptomyces sp. DSM 44938]
MKRTVRDLSGPLVVVNRFAVKQDPRLFEQEFLQHVGRMGRLGKVELMATFRSLNRPQMFTHFGFWRTLGAFLEAVHDEVFQRQAEHLGALVETRADQAECLGEVIGFRASGLLRSARTVVTQYRVTGDRDAFEERLWARADHLARHGGPSGACIFRSIISPQEYTTLDWGEDSHLFEYVWHSDRFREIGAEIAEFAVSETDVSRCVAEKGGRLTGLQRWYPGVAVSMR